MERSEARAILAPGGTLRAAINFGNAALAERLADGSAGGVTAALAHALAEDLGVPLDIVTFEGAGKVFAAAGEDVWDVAFLAIDAKRAGAIAYTEPYALLEAVFAVPATSEDRSTQALDRPGARLVVAKGSAYDLALSETIRHAELVRAPTPGESFALYREGGYTAVAGVRQSLEAAFADDPSVRLLDDVIGTIAQAMAVPKAKAAALSYLDGFIAARKADGFVRAALDAGRGRGLRIAP